jgi:hypothetical protein
MVLGAVAGYFWAINVILPRVNNGMFTGWPYLIIGVTFRLVGGSVLSEIYNRKVIDNYEKNKNH